MAEVGTIRLDIAKAVFHAHGADARGQMVFSRRLTEFGWVAPKGPSHIRVLATLLEEVEEIGASLPEAAPLDGRGSSSS